jgi:signal transduction histidine kinase
MLKSIRLRMTITYLLLIALAMLITGLLLFNMLEKYYLLSAEENLKRTGRLTSELVLNYLREDADAVFLSSIAENFSRQINARVIFVSPQQTVLGDSQRVGGLLGVKMNRAEIAAALEGKIGQSVQYSELSRQWVLQVALPVEEGGVSRGAVFLSASLNPVYETLAAVRRLFLGATLGTMLVAGALIVLFAHRLTEPILKLTTAAQQLAAGCLDQHIPVRTDDEIGRLARQFNIMATKVKATNNRLTRFVADVSHELRTPLSSIHVCLQTLQDYELEPAEQKEFLEDINYETQRLIYLVEDLLAITKRQEVAEKRETFSLAALLGEVANATFPRAERRGLQFFTEIPPDLPGIHLSREDLKRVLFNLLDNALQYTPAGGRVKLAAVNSGKEVCITIQDTGCGVPEEALPHLFERFYRVDQARSRHLGGTGLGLAICKEIINHYGGEIGVRENPEKKGSSFYFTLPAALFVTASPAGYAGPPGAENNAPAEKPHQLNGGI